MIDDHGGEQSRDDNSDSSVTDRLLLSPPPSRPPPPPSPPPAVPRPPSRPPLSLFIPSFPSSSPIDWNRARNCASTNDRGENGEERDECQPSQPNPSGWVGPGENDAVDGGGTGGESFDETDDDDDDNNGDQDNNINMVEQGIDIRRWEGDTPGEDDRVRGSERNRKAEALKQLVAARALYPSVPSRRRGASSLFGYTHSLSSSFSSSVEIPLLEYRGLKEEEEKGDKESRRKGVRSRQFGRRRHRRGMSTSRASLLSSWVGMVLWVIILSTLLSLTGQTKVLRSSLSPLLFLLAAPVVSFLLISVIRRGDFVTREEEANFAVNEGQEGRDWKRRRHDREYELQQRRRRVASS